MIFFSAFAYSQNKSDEITKEKQTVPHLKFAPNTINVLKPQSDTIQYKMLVKKVENPERYLVLVKKAEKAMIDIPNLQTLPKKPR